MSRALRRYEARVRDLGCLVCQHMGLGPTPASLHHPRIEVGGAQKESDWLQIPLCPYHHQGAGGIHTLGDRDFYLRYRLTELDLVALVIEKLNT